MKDRKIIIVSLLLVLILSSVSAACIKKTAASSPVINGTKIEKPGNNVIKPQAQVNSVSASTVGLVDDYTVILEAIINNSGAEGVVIVNAKITQSTNNWVKQQPVFMPKNSTQTVRFVFPIKWKGGDWTPEVWTELP